jgi:FMN phosphatase YigB (HAD superfamily)
MVYFLDFDRTLFDSDAFVAHVLERHGGTYHAKEPEERLQAAVAASFEKADIAFAPGELAPFVYRDVPEFLRAAGNEAIILTFGNPALQKLKIENALAGIPRVSVLYTNDRRKGMFLKERIAAYAGSSPVFVDDRTIELEDMERECPSVRLFEMRRDGGVGDGRWPVIHSLSELP